MPANREQIEQLVAAAPNFRIRWEGFLKDWEGEYKLADIVRRYACARPAPEVHRAFALTVNENHVALRVLPELKRDGTCSSHVCRSF